MCFAVRLGLGTSAQVPRLGADSMADTFEILFFRVIGSGTEQSRYLGAELVAGWPMGNLGTWA